MISTILASLTLLKRAQRFKYFSLVTLRILVHFLDIAGLLLLGLLGLVASRGLEGFEPVEIIGLTVQISSRGDLTRLILLVGVLFVSKSILSALLLRITTRTLAKFESAFSEEIAAAMFSAGLERFTLYPRANIHWLITTSTQVAFSGILFSSATVLTEGALFIAVFAVFLWTDALTALAVAAYFALLVMTFQALVSKRLFSLGERMRLNSINTNSALLTLSDVFRETTVHRVKTRFLRKLLVSRSGLADNQALQRFLFGLPRPFVEAGMIVGVLLLALFLFNTKPLDDALTVLAVFMAGGVRMMAAILPLQNGVNDLKVTVGQARPAQDFVKEVRSSHQNDDDGNLFQAVGLAGEVSRGSISVRNLDYKFPDADSPSLMGINLHIERGTRAALIGKSGSGKSTLVELILGLRKAERGAVQVGGQDPYRERNELATRLAYVPQRPGVIPGAELWSNISLEAEEELVDFARLERSVLEANLADYVANLPDGLHTRVGDQGIGLSGGQLQRVGLARALYRDADVIVLDEATSALDAESELGVVESLESLGKEVTQIIIAHRLSTIQRADVVFIVDSGQVVDSGTLRDLRARNPNLAYQIELMNVED